MPRPAKRAPYMAPKPGEPQFTCGRCDRPWALKHKHPGWAACRNCYLDRKKKDTKPEYSRRTHLKRRYGLTLEQVDELLVAQGGKCPICMEALVLPTQSGSRRGDAAVDHDHLTGHVRGLLCPWCNRALGMLQDDPVRALRAARYLLADAETGRSRHQPK